jgi:hypothetical protein
MSSPKAPDIASTERSTSSNVVRQLHTEMRMQRTSCQVVALTQHVPSAWIARTIASTSPSGRTSTWLRPWASTSTPGRSSNRSAKRSAQAHSRSTSSATPRLPSERRVA